MNLGRNQLLQWVNDIAQADYSTIQSLADGVAYCQIFEAIHPNSVNVSRMTLVTKLPLDCLRNLKLLESALKNLKITMTVSLEKMANGKFQDNIIFTQWLYTHAQKYGKQNLQNYQAFERRLQILQKQCKRQDEMNIHLIPQQIYQQNAQADACGYQDGYRNRHMQEDYQQNLQLEERIQEISNYITCLEGELKDKMELNWKTMHMIGRAIDERNVLYGLLEQIEQIAQNCGESPVQKEILRILYEKPEHFIQSNK